MLEGPLPDLARRVHLRRHESDLGSWIEAQCFPHPALAEQVALIFYGQGAVTYRRDRILPSGLTHLLINLGPPQYLMSRHGEARESFRELWFSGQQESFLETEAPLGTCLIGVVFRPFGAYAALASDQHLLTGKVVDLTTLLGDQVRGLRQRLLETTGIVARLARVESWLLDQLTPGRSPHPVTRWAVERILASAGRVRVHELAAASGYSRKHLLTLFRHEVGLSPKTLARVQRFHRALALSRQTTKPRWSHIAADCGYYDQSHLIRDVRRFTGLTPRHLVATPAPDQTTLALR